MNSEQELNVIITPKLNRCHIYTSFPKNIPVSFALYYNLKSPNIQIRFNKDSNILKDNEIDITIVRNLNNSDFCNCFLKLNTFIDSTTNASCSFSGVKNNFNDSLFQFMNEKTCLNSKCVNSISISGWRLYGIENDFIFYFIERKVMDIVTNILNIRTCGLQFSTKRGIRLLSEYYEKNKNSVLKVKNNELPDFLRGD